MTFWRCLIAHSYSHSLTTFCAPQWASKRWWPAGRSVDLQIAAARVRTLVRRAARRRERRPCPSRRYPERSAVIKLVLGLVLKALIPVFKKNHRHDASEEGHPPSPAPPPINGLCNSRLCRPRPRPLRLRPSCLGAESVRVVCFTAAARYSSPDPL